MTEQEVERLVRVITRCQLFLLLVAYGFILHFFIFGSSDKYQTMLQRRLIEKTFSSSILFGLAISTIAKQLFTTVASLDYMVREILDQFHWEEFLEHGGNVKQILKRSRGGKEAQLHHMRKDRRDHLRELVKLGTSEKDQRSRARTSMHGENNRLNDIRMQKKNSAASAGYPSKVGTPNPVAATKNKTHI